MAAYTASNVTQTVFGDQKITICRITGNGAAYTTGGDAVSADWFGMKRVEFIIFSSTSITVPDTLASFNRGAAGVAPKIALAYPNLGSDFSGPNSKVFDCIVIGQ